MAATKPGEVDKVLKAYTEQQAKVDAAKATLKSESELLEKQKAALIPMVQHFGSHHTEKSIRLQGDRYRATVTTGVMSSTDDAAVAELQAELKASRVEGIFSRFFIAKTTYHLAENPRGILAELALGKRIREKLELLIGRCVKDVPKAPSLKVELI